ncbi:MAG: LamB/YcsF family protein, partial [Ilumatobacteraceae bacterium]
LGALDAFAQVAGAGVRYVKPHGALYHVATVDAAAAGAVVEAAAEYDPSLAVLGAPGSELLRRAEAAGLEPVPEAFADRTYAPDGSLVPRRRPDALITDPATAATQAVRLVTDRQVVAIDGSVIDLEARSICVHGDTPGAVELAWAVRDSLSAAGVRLGAFVA